MQDENSRNNNFTNVYELSDERSDEIRMEPLGKICAEKLKLHSNIPTGKHGDGSIMMAAPLRKTEINTNTHRN